MDEMKAVTSRNDWANLARNMLDAVAFYRTDTGSLINFPGARPSASGLRSDGMEGFARTFWLAACGVSATTDYRDRDRLLAPYAAGLAAGTDPSHPERWPNTSETPQIMVEAGSIAFALHTTKDDLWIRLDEPVRERVADYLLRAVGFPVGGNWHFFRVMVHAFLRSVGYDIAMQPTVDSLEAVASYYRGEGWYSDGDGPKARTFDYYNAWAFHLYPALWSLIEGRRIAPELVATFAERSAAHVDSLSHMIGRDGAPVYQGRSLIYRAAMAAPFAGAAIIGADVAPGLLRNASNKTMGFFLRSGSVSDHPLQMGWVRSTPEIAQAYSGPASPYWLSKAFVNLLLPEDHPYWAASLTPLPIEQSSFSRYEPVPGWLLQGSFRDGIVRLHNHGTFRPREGRDPHSRHLRDDPNYSRIAYSTATAPVLDATAPQLQPARCPDNSIVVRTATGEPMLREELERDSYSDGALHSTFRLIDPAGASGPLTVDLASEPLGSAERRTFRLAPLTGEEVTVTGYALASAECAVQLGAQSIHITTPNGLTSWLRLESKRTCEADTEAITRPNAFGDSTTTPLLRLRGLQTGESVVVICSLTREGLEEDGTPVAH